VRNFQIYRWDPAKAAIRASTPTKSTSSLRPMVLDALIKIKNEIDPT